jgi:hypothetical protein
MKRRTNCRRGKKGGMAPLQSGPYPGSGGGQWSTSVGGNSVAAAANAYKPFLSQFAAESGGAGANPALARELAAGYAMTGPGQTGGGSRRHKRHHKRGKRHGSKRMRMSRSQAQGQSQAQGEGQSGGMFATFGALIKEALVPLGLLAAQQAYGKSYDKKHRSSKNYTRKRRGGGAGNIAIY